MERVDVVVNITVPELIESQKNDAPKELLELTEATVAKPLSQMLIEVEWASNMYEQIATEDQEMATIFYASTKEESAK